MQSTQQHTHSHDECCAEPAQLRAEKHVEKPWFAATLVSLVVIVTVCAYAPVLFDFFLGDDFVHLTWLKDAVVNPELIWRNFHSSWLDGTTTRFYRPLISVFMVTDYLVWKTNGLGFHITNVVFHLIATVFLFFTARLFLADARAASEAPKEERQIPWLYPLAASLIFGLYPLHTEAVSWITGRVDAVVTAFYVSTFYFYLRWRKGGGFAWFAATIAGLTLGLLSKEMALTLPPAFILYEALLGPNALFQKKPNASGFNLFSWALNVVKPTAFFWLMLVVYFGVRRYALGTFVGGYDDSLFFIADLKHFALSWLHGLKMFFIPLNKGLMGAHHYITKSWEITLAVTAILGLINLYLERALVRLFVFNLFFMALCFAPVYKIFTIADDLQGSRLAHVATVALSLLVAMAMIVPQRALSRIAKGTTKKPNAQLRIALCLVFATLCFAALWTNNQAWAFAGREANAIRAALSRYYDHTAGDPQVLILGLPDQKDGCYISRNALWGMTKFPQLQRDVNNCLMLNKYEQIMPFGFLKESLYESKGDVQILFWDEKKRDFETLSLVKNPPTKTVWTAAELDGICQVKNGSFLWSKKGSASIAEVRGGNPKSGRPELIINPGKYSCFDIEFLAIRVRNLDTTDSSTPFLASEGLDLLYTNDIRPNFDLPDRTHADFAPNKTAQTLIFPLKNLPEWALGGNLHEFKLRLPRGCELAIDSIEIVPANKLMPKASFANSGYMGLKGYLHLSQKDQETAISVDASDVPGAASTVLEISRANLQFETQNTPSPSKVMMSEINGTKSGDILLKREMFPATGLYEARPWAVDQNGKKLGVAGDHFVISVDS